MNELAMTVAKELPRRGPKFLRTDKDFNLWRWSEEEWKKFDALVQKHKNNKAVPV